MNALFSLIRGIVTTLAFVNFFGVTVAFVWLLVIGEWRPVLAGVITLGFGTWIVSLVVAPALLLALPAMALYQKGHRRSAYPLLFGSSLLNNALVGVWCAAVMYYFARPDSLPHLLWAYGIATGALSSLARAERSAGGDAAGAEFVVFFASLGLFLCVVGLWAWGWSGFTALVVLGSVLVLGSVWQMAAMLIAQGEHDRGGAVFQDFE